MVRSAVIGLTNAGAEHARAYAADPLSDLAGVFDADSDRAVAVAKELGTKAFPTFDDLLREKPNLVTVRSAVPERFDEIRQLVDAGINVVSAFPVAETAAELERLAERANSSGTVIAGDFHLRFTPTMRKTQAWVEEGAVGTPLFINMTLFSGGSDKDPDLFRNLGAHGIDMLTALCGPVATVQCFGVKAPEREGWSTAQINIRFAAEIVGTLTLSADMTHRHPWARVELAGSKARLTIENVYEEATLFPHADEEKRVITNSIFGGLPQMKATYGIRLHRLLEQLSAGEKPSRIDGGTDQVLAASRVMEAAFEAAQHNTVVTPVGIPETTP